MITIDYPLDYVNPNNQAVTYTAHGSGLTFELAVKNLKIYELNEETEDIYDSYLLEHAALDIQEEVKKYLREMFVPLYLKEED